MIAGEQECYNYIKRHCLPKDKVVAVINDETLNDWDLIFMEDGLLIHDGQSLAATRARLAIFNIFELINQVLKIAIDNTVSYASVEYEEQRIKRPRYKNKNVDMNVLFEIIDEIKQDAEGSIESRISKSIKGISK